MRINRKRVKRIICGCLCFFLLVAGSGCGKKAAKEENDREKTNTGTRAKGRFVEEDINMPEDVLIFYDLKVSSDGYLQLISANTNHTLQMHISTDNGASWEKQEYIADNAIPEGYEVLAAAVNESGVIFTAYAEIEEESVWGAIVKGYYSYCAIFPDGTVKEIPITHTGGDTAFGYGARSIAITDDGNAVYLKSMEGEEPTVYLVSGESQEIINEYTLESDSVFLTGKDILVESGGSVNVYDQENGEKIGTLEIEDTYLTNETMFISGIEENMYYFANQQGVFRYVSGGNTIDQLMEGSFMTLGNGELNMERLLRIREQEFIILYQNDNRECTIKRYVYDHEIPSRPDKELTVYSLYDMTDVRKMILEFQKDNPDVYIDYQIGIERGGEERAEDVVKLLNTEILAGNGPDVLILNSLPLDSYMEKEALLDLSDIIQPRIEKEEVYENIVTVYEQEGSIMAVPVNFKVPLLYGNEKMRNTITDLQGFLSYMESDDVTHFSGDFILATPYERKELMHRFVEMYGHTFAAGIEIDKKALESFLVNSKAIYEIMMEKVYEALPDDAVIEEPEDIDTSKISDKRRELMLRQEDSYYHAAGLSHNMYILSRGEALMMFGYATSMVEVSDMTYGSRVKEGLDYILPVDGTNYFMPGILAGVNAKSTDTELAMTFVDFMLSEKGQNTQKLDQGVGFSVNKQVFKEDMKRPSEDYLEKTGTNLEGYDWPEQEAFDRFEQIVEGLDTVVLMDAYMFDELYEQARQFFKGEKEVEAVVDDFSQKMTIYMAE